MKKIKIYTVDAFSNEPFLGNPAGVVINEELSNKEMQLIAKELNLSETAFVYQIKSDEYDYLVKYYTPTMEINFCGHATIALGWLLAINNQIKNNNSLLLKTNIGIIPIEFKYQDNQLEAVIMKQVEPRITDITYNLAELSNLIGLNKDDFDLNYPIKIAYTGNNHLIIPVKSKSIIDKAKPNFEQLKIHNKYFNIATTHLFTLNVEDEECLVYTRDFAPNAGINEDPVTGSANGALAAYLAIHNIVLNDEYTIIQGNSSNRKGTLYIKLDRSNDKYLIKVGGNARIMIEGYITI